jgi:uncharacterized LabA/DUF88 family protein
MKRFAIFVDAGYLFAGGSSCLFQEPKRREELSLDLETLKTFLIEKSIALCGEHTSILRIYWYDGASGGRLSTEQQLIANSENIKLRLGIINSVGQQKGVDAKIVTDLVELSRNNSISDAILFGGDEDLRIGIELSQEYGIRAHLICIDKAGTSPTLKQECDTVTVLDKQDIEKFLSLKQKIELPNLNPPTTLAEVASQYVQRLTETDRANLAQVLKTNVQIPKEHDGKLLAQARDALGHDLEADEKKQLRTLFKSALGDNK